MFGVKGILKRWSPV